MFEGVPNYPDASRFWQIVDKYKVNIFYTAPTAIRSLMSLGEEFLQNTSRASLRVLGTVGEPINPEAWEWYYHKVGLSNCPIVDTWWQTETGGHMILSFPFANKLKPSSAGLPFFGIKIELLDKEGNELNGVAEGVMAISTSWPGQMSGLYNNPKRFMDAYFSDFKGKYFPGDGAKRDSDGYLWITGRVDDVLNVSGHRIGTAEIESALTKNSKVAESAIVGIDHEIKGQSIYAFVCLKPQIEPSEELKKELNSLVRKNIGAIASLDAIQFSPDLPKTRSGKIMRRVLRKIANNNFDSFGDLSTLAEPEIVDILVEGKKKLNK
jgi:acetyl-CoA synthetase